MHRLRKAPIKLLIKPGILAFIIISLSSCDPFNNIDGLVVEENTNHPIDSVLVSVKFKNHVLDSFSLITDSLTKTQRKAFIGKYGNKENWIDGGGEKMFRNIPTLTSGDGKFNIGFPAGFFPRYKLCLEKPGYETFEIKNRQIDWDERPQVFRMKKKRGG